jgi:hypothetical protein
MIGRKCRANIRIRDLHPTALLPSNNHLDLKQII